VLIVLLGLGNGGPLLAPKIAAPVWALGDPAVGSRLGRLRPEPAHAGSQKRHRFAVQYRANRALRRHSCEQLLRWRSHGEPVLDHFAWKSPKRSQVRFTLGR
jgi:hypothetical protein